MYWVFLVACVAIVFAGFWTRRRRKARWPAAHKARWRKEVTHATLRSYGLLVPGKRGRVKPEASETILMQVFARVPADYDTYTASDLVAGYTPRQYLVAQIMADAFCDWRGIAPDRPFSDRAELLLAVARDKLVELGKAHMAQDRIDHGLKPLNDDEIRSLHQLTLYAGLPIPGTDEAELRERALRDVANRVPFDRIDALNAAIAARDGGRRG